MISEKVQVLIELLKAGNGSAAAATDLRAVEAQAGKTSEACTRLRNTLSGLFAGVSAGFAVTEITQATLKAEQMNNTLRSVTGSSQGASREFNFVRQEADRLGLELESTVGAYTKLSAAAKGTSLAGNDVREIFLGVAEAGTVLGLSVSQQEGALQALQQMISKGTVQAEELRGQLGERLPGAFQIASRAMGVTTQELGKMLEQGQVISSDFLPKFAAELRRTFSADAERSAASLNSELNRMKTAFFELKASLGGDARGLIAAAIGTTTDTLQMLTRNKEALEALAITTGIFAVELGALMLVQRGWIATQALFGAAWLKSAADVAAATTLIATSTVAMTAAVSASLAGATVGVWALVEAIRMLNAESEESASRDNLLAQTEARRKAVEREIQLRLQLGQITSQQASELNAQLVQAFDARITSQYQPLGGMSPARPLPVTTSDPDIEARRRALTQVSRVLEPGIVPVTKTDDPVFKGVVNTEAKQEMLRTTEQLRSLQERMFIESLQGLEQEEARIQANFEARERQIEQLNKKLNLGTEELAQMRDLNVQVRDTEISEVRLREQQKAKADEQKRKTELAREANEEMQRLEQQLTTQAVGNSETRIQQATREFEARIQLIDKLFAAGKIDAERWNELSLQAGTQRVQTMAPAVSAGRMEAEKLDAVRAGEDSESIELNRQFQNRRESLEAYYDFEIEQAEGNATQIEEIETRKAANIHQLGQQQRIANSQFLSGLQEIGHVAQTQFAGGMARAFVSIADGSKSAKEAFREFAANFLKMIAEMIIQLLVFIALRAVLKSIPGVGAWLSGGGVATGDSSSLMAGQGWGAADVAAKGGWFESLRAPAIAAAAGVALASSGIEGVAAVNGPTFLPNFNVLAGEAGREVLTVMAKPQMLEVNGMRAIVGSVGTKQVAMMSAADMLALGRPRLMAAGGMQGITPGNFPSSPTNGLPGPLAGAASIQVALGRDLEARMIHNAIEGAVLRVTQELQQDGRLSAAVKRLVR